MTREEAMRRVVEAARAWCANRQDVLARQFALTPDTAALAAAVDALDALPADPQAQGETVEVRGCVGVDGASVYAYGAKRSDESDADLTDTIRAAGYEPVCFFTVYAPATTQPLPVIPATVEPKP